MSERIKSVINYANMRKQFAESLRNIVRNAVATGSNDSALESLHDVIAPINIVVQCIDNTDALNEVRSLLDDLSKTVSDENRIRQEIKGLDLDEYDTFASYLQAGSPDAETGSVTENGKWYGFFDFSDNRIDAAILSHFKYRGNIRGVILIEDDQGFKDVETYDTAESYAAACQAYEEEVTAYYEGDE